MNDLENLPDDFWQKAFEGADEQPPQRVWSAIEHQLDNDRQTRVLPLWGLALPALNTLRWGTGLAASVALVLAGWWYVHTAGQPARMAATTAAHHAPADKLTTDSPEIGNRMAAVQATSPMPRLAAESHPSATVSSPGTNSFDTRQETIAQAVGRAGRSAYSAPVRGFDPVNNPPSMQVRQRLTIARTDVAFGPTAYAPAAVMSLTNQAQRISTPNEPVSFDELSVGPLALPSARPINRIVWVSAEVPTESPAAVTNSATRPVKREKWASLSLTPGTFNPAVALASTPVSAGNNVYRATASPAVESHSSRSVAYQASAGVQLTERWSVETGVGYMAAQSTVESPAQTGPMNTALIVANGAQPTTNLFIDAIRRNRQGQANAAPVFDQTSQSSAYVPTQYSAVEQQRVSNDYQFVQVPVQVGYQLRPRKRLGLALIGGFLTNIFVRNTVGNQEVVTPADDIYRSLSWSASLGARFRYRPSQRWSASMAGLYQPTLGRTTVSGSPIESRPTSAGMSFGVDYHF